MRTFRIPILLILVVVMTAVAAFAAGASAKSEELFRDANGLYAAGKYREAIARYGEIAAQGFESGNLYYNIGNAYFKLNDIGRARLYYERSRALMPLDADLKSNLAYLKTMIDEPSLTATPLAWWKRIVRNFTALFSLNHLTVLVSGFYLCAVVLILLMVLGRERFGKALRAGLIIVVIAGAALAVSLAARIHDKETLRPAIIVAKEEEGRYEPLAQATAYFKLHAGSRVAVVDEEKGWAKVRRVDGKAAWVRSEALEEL